MATASFSKAGEQHHWERGLLPYLVTLRPGFEGGLWVLWTPGLLSRPRQADPLCYSFALRSRAAGARHWLLREVDESGMAPQGPWVARGEAALMCQSLSPEVPEPRETLLGQAELWSCRQQLLHLPEFATPCSEHGPAMHLAPVRHTAGELESVHQREHAYTCLWPCRGHYLPHTVCAGQDASLGNPRDLHRFARKSGAADPALSVCGSFSCQCRG